MSTLTLQTIQEKNLNKIIKKLNESGDLLDNHLCPLCNNKIDNIGGFMPQDGKIAFICDKLPCILNASYKVMKSNGNGSPVIE
ncbi:MAG: hypothetical protein ISS47_06605 [Candidatus Omnitrophica bacterium]|nr:hypothetical protein [Candidatus Omnitrophota bacterium]